MEMTANKKRKLNEQNDIHFATSAGNFEMVRLSMENGANIESRSKDKYRNTPLMIAAKIGYIEIVNFLMENKADVNARNQYGWTSLHFAVVERKFDVIQIFHIVKILIEIGGAQTDIENVDNEYPHDFAIRNGNFDISKYLYEKGNFKQTFLFCAAKKGHIKLAKYLIGENFDVNATNEDENASPLHASAQFGKLNIMKFLVNNGAKLDAKDIDGHTPLMMAAKNGYIKIVKFLTEKGADVNLKAKNSETPLHFNTKYFNSDIGIVKFLVENKAADVNAKDNEHYTPLHFAVMNGKLDIVKFLINNGADVNVKTEGDGFSPLSLAASRANIEIVKLLIKSKAKVDTKLDNGATPLHVAAFEDMFENVKILFENGAKIDERDVDYRTPFDIANKHGNHEIAKYLLEKKMETKNHLPRESISNKSLCIICTLPRNGFYVLMPCMHASLCEPCCYKLTNQKNSNSKCPSCRKPIQNYHEIFFQECE